MDHGPSCWAGASKLDFDWIQLDWTGLQFKDRQVLTSCGAVVYCPYLAGKQGRMRFPSQQPLVERPSSPARRLGDT